MTATDQSRDFGEVFTRRWVVEVLLDRCGYTADRDLSSLTLVEPSVGRGAFLVPVVERLVASAVRHGRELAGLAPALRCFDLQEHNVQHCRGLAHRVLLDAACPHGDATRLVDQWIKQADFLLDETPLSADLVVGNPPYIRLEDVDAQTSVEYRRRWPSMSGRADVYIGFYERSLVSLKPGGHLGFICADRWMRNQYGSRLRSLVASAYSVEDVWVMHDVDAFEEQVSAYPAITVIRRGSQGPAVVAATDPTFGPASAAELTAWSSLGLGIELHGRGFKAHRVPHWFAGDEMWPAGSPARLALIERLNDQFPLLHDPKRGTRIGIGVATGADQIYVVENPDLVEADRALPLAVGQDLRSGTFAWGGKYLVNPWDATGSLVELEEFPKLRAYLEGSGSRLRDRHTARKSPQGWYRTIDKVDASLTARPKLLFRDLGASANPVLDPGGHYPHHNLYYLVSEEWDLEVLGGLLLSRVAQAFIEAYCVRMRGGTLRFQAQYLRRIRVPDQGTIDPSAAADLREAFRRRDAHMATEAAGVAYGLDLSEYELTEGERRDDDRGAGLRTGVSECRQGVLAYPG